METRKRKFIDRTTKATNEPKPNLINKRKIKSISRSSAQKKLDFSKETAHSHAPKEIRNFDKEKSISILGNPFSNENLCSSAPVLPYINSIPYLDSHTFRNTQVDLAEDEFWRSPSKTVGQKMIADQDEEYFWNSPSKTVLYPKNDKPACHPQMMLQDSPTTPTQSRAIHVHFGDSTPELFTPPRPKGANVRTPESKRGTKAPDAPQSGRTATMKRVGNAFEIIMEIDSPSRKNGKVVPVYKYETIADSVGKSSNAIQSVILSPHHSHSKFVIATDLPVANCMDLFLSPESRKKRRRY